MDKKARIERISMMEERYNKVTRVLAGLEEAVAEYEEFRDELEVLSEDGLYNLLHDTDQIIRHSLEVLGK